MRIPSCPKVVACFVSCWFIATGLADTAGPPPQRSWQVGDRWIISMERHASAVPQSKREFMNTVVVGAQDLEGVNCWKIFFIPEGEEGSVTLMLDRQTGWPRRVVTSANPPQPSLERVGQGTIFAAPPPLPIEIFPFLQEPKTTFEAATGTLTIERHVSGKDITLEAVYKSNGTEAWRVEQRWVEGEKWWREYERHVKGQKDLHASILEPASGNDDKKKPTVPDQSGFRVIESTPGVRIDVRRAGSRNTIAPIRPSMRPSTLVLGTPLSSCCWNCCTRPPGWSSSPTRLSTSNAASWQSWTAGPCRPTWSWNRWLAPATCSMPTGRKSKAATGWSDT